MEITNYSVPMIKVNNCKDRENIVIGLVNAGYVVWIHKEKIQNFPESSVDYYVCYCEQISTEKNNKALSTDNSSDISKDWNWKSNF